VDGLRAAARGHPGDRRGIIPKEDEPALCERGVAAVFTPKDYALTEIMDQIVTVIRRRNGLAD